MVRPITPQQARENRDDSIPDEVIEAFNELITENLDANGVSATVRQDDAVKRILVKYGELAPSPQELFDNGWLNVESYYEKAGWSVSYDKPGYNESYPATFEFRAKRR